MLFCEQVFHVKHFAHNLFPALYNIVDVVFAGRRV